MKGHDKKIFRFFCLGWNILIYRADHCPAEPGQVEVQQGQRGVPGRPAGILEGKIDRLID